MEAIRHAPRNPDVKAPGLQEIIGSGGALGAQASIPFFEVKVWQTGEVPPPATAVLARGHLIVFAQGLIFLPDSLRFDPDLMVRIAKGVTEHTLSKLVEAAIPLGEGLSSALAENLIDLWFEEKHHQAVKSFEELFRHPFTFLIPYIEVVETSRQSVTKWLRSTDYSVITQESATGERKSYCITIVEDALLQYTNAKLLLPHWPGILMQWRFDRESMYLFREVETKLIDEDAVLKALMEKWDAPETHIISMLHLLMKLSTDYSAPFTQYDGVMMKLLEKHDALKADFKLTFKKNFNLTVGELVENFAGDFNAACKKQLDEKGFNTRYVAAALLERLASLRDQYKRVPVMAHRIELLEAAARGESDDWSPNWTPEY